MRKFGLLIILLMGLSAVAMADNNGVPHGCNHQHFVTYSCLEGYLDGINGQDGEEGPIGPVGPQGPQGVQGVQGERGVAGVVPTDWYDELRNFIAADGAAHAYIPDNSDNRLTFQANRVDARTAVGVGYARKINEDAAVSIAVGRAGNQVVGKVAFTAEF